MKKEYMKPKMKGVQLQQRTHLLQASEPKMLSGSKGEDSASDIWYELE